MPIVFSFTMAMVWMIEIFGIHGAVGAILTDVGAGYVENSYVFAAIESGSDDEGPALSNICEDIITEGGLIMRIRNDYAYTFMDDLYCGINIFQVSESVDIWADYMVRPPVNIPGFNGIRLHNRFYSKKFTGYTPAKTDEETVYVTKGSKVYHTHLECTALKTDIREVSFGEVENHRNNGGSKYYACNKCEAQNPHGIVYITPYGNRFHTSRDCQELKLNVYKIPKSEIGEKRKCYYCE